MNRRLEIKKAQDNIKTIILQQAEHGAQTIVVKSIDNALYSLGQFVGDNERDQRGIHGSASGLRVLSAYTSHNRVIQGLIKYIEERNVIEQAIETNSGTTSHKNYERDDINIIKLSEILYSLSYVTAGQASCEPYKQELINKILTAEVSIQGKTGWNYYIDNQNQHLPDILPTAFAILALNRNGKSTPDAQRHLKELLETRTIENPSSFSEMVFGLYALVESYGESWEDDKSAFKKIFAVIKESPHCNLESDYEQNLEYWYGGQHNYIRIPWQIYLLVISSKLSKIYFYSVNMQKRLKNIINYSLNRGFSYPYSGPNIPTRTNSIIYDSLGIIKSNIGNDFYSILFLSLDYVRTLLGSKVARFVYLIIGISLAGYSIYKWFIKPETEITDIAPEFLGELVILLISMGKKKE